VVLQISLCYALGSENLDLSTFDGMGLRRGFALSRSGSSRLGWCHGYLEYLVSAGGQTVSEPRIPRLVTDAKIDCDSNVHKLDNCTPLAQVIQQLRCEDANMSHCKLGRRGAKALRYALTSNTTMTSLDLTDNQLDAVAVRDIAAGLTSGTLANFESHQRKNLVNKCNSLDWVKVCQRQTIAC
jgi:hypothetical protein